MSEMPLGLKLHKKSTHKRNPLSGDYLYSEIDYQCTNLPRALLWCISAFCRVMKSDVKILSPSRAGLDDVNVREPVKNYLADC